MMSFEFAQSVAERGWVPDKILRKGIQSLLKQRLRDVQAAFPEFACSKQNTFIHSLDTFSIALLPDTANEQHYELPTEFFSVVLGRHLKYSCGFWSDGVDNLDQAEQAALEVTCQRAGLIDGQSVLELGCGWGSLSLWMASAYPASNILAVSNSETQREYILAEAKTRGLTNLQVLSADMNDFEAPAKFDRIVSVEMFEHMRNWRTLFSRVDRWLKPQGQFFMHVFAHRSIPYLFENQDASDWMSRHFFSGGMMPSLDLPLFFQDDLRLEHRWVWGGQHYANTANAWLSRMDRNRDRLWPVFESTYGKDFAQMWWVRWRVFFMACEELFAFNDGQEWMVAHYRFVSRKN